MLYLGALDLEFHVVLPRGLAVLALLPAVAVPAVPDLLPAVQQHRPTFRPGTPKLFYAPQVLFSQYLCYGQNNHALEY